MANTEYPASDYVLQALPLASEVRRRAASADRSMYSEFPAVVRERPQHLPPGAVINGIRRVIQVSPCASSDVQEERGGDPQRAFEISPGRELEMGVRLPCDPARETSGGASEDSRRAVSDTTYSCPEELTGVMKGGSINIVREYDGVRRPPRPTGQSIREPHTAQFQMLDQGCKMPLNQRFCLHLLTWPREVAQPKHPAVAPRFLSDLRLIKQRKQPSHTTNQIHRALRHPGLGNPPWAVLIADGDVRLQRLVGFRPIR